MGMRRRVFAPALMAIVVDAMGFGLVYPLMTELFAGVEGLHMAAGMSVGLRHFYLGLCFLLYPLATFFSAPWMNDLAERYGGKKILLLCMGGQTVGFLLMGAGVEFVNVAVLLVGRALSGLMAGSQPIAQASLIDQSPPEHKRRNLSVLAVVVAAGIVIGPLIGGIFSDENLVAWFTLSTPFYIAAALALITTIWVGASFPSLQVLSDKPRSYSRPLMIFWEGFKHPKMGSLALVFLCMQLGFSLFYQMIQVFVSTVFSFPSWEIGVFNGFLGVAFALVLLFGIKFFLHFLPVEKVASLALLLTGVFLILPMLYPQEVFVWVMAFLAAGFNMVAYGALMACFASAVDTAQQRWVMALFGSIVAAAWTVTGLATNLIDSIGLRWLIAIGGLLLLLSYFLMVRRNASASSKN
ncbi:MFS transporter [Chlamydiota bacterium]